MPGTPADWAGLPAMPAAGPPAAVAGMAGADMGAAAGAEDCPRKKSSSEPAIRPSAPCGAVAAGPGVAGWGAPAGRAALASY